MTSISMRFFAAVLSNFLFIAASGAIAAEITLHPNRYSPPMKEIQILGPIESGDYEKFEAVVKKAGPSYRRVMLMSQGGDVVEAMKIGRLIRKLRFETNAPSIFYCPLKSRTRFLVTNPKCRCLSACFLIYAGGVSRWGGKLGIHRPYIHPERLKSLSDTKVEKGMKSAENVVRNYLIDMNIPRDLINIMMEQSSKNIHNLTKSQSDRIKGNVPFLEELKIARCKKISPEEENLFHALNKKTKPGHHDMMADTMGGKLSPGDQRYLNEEYPERTETEQKMFELLHQKWERNYRCGSDLRKEISEKAFSTWVNK